MDRGDVMNHYIIIVAHPEKNVRFDLLGRSGSVPSTSSKWTGAKLDRVGGSCQHSLGTSREAVSHRHSVVLRCTPLTVDCCPVVEYRFIPKIGYT